MPAAPDGNVENFLILFQEFRLEYPYALSSDED
jgi:hypothetical protein